MRTPVLVKDALANRFKRPYFGLRPRKESLAACIRYYGRSIRLVLRFFGRLRVPLGVDVFLAAALAVPLQSHEVYRGFAEAPLESLLPIATSFLALVILSAAISLVSLAVLKFLMNRPLRLRHLLALGLISSVPFGALSAGLIAAKFADGKWGEAVNCRLELAGLFSLGMALVAAIYPLWLQHRSPRVIHVLSRKFCMPSFALVWAAWISISTVLVLLLGPIVAGGVGPIAILSWFALSVLVAATHLGVMSDRYGYPLLGFVVLTSFVFSALGLNHNHEIRTLDTYSREIVADLPKAFEDWLSNRADLAAYKVHQLPYPVFVISAEGGGIYAAYNTALTLARLQDSCPRFAQHTFAISGVSGGSVGAGVFSALAANSARNEENIDCGPATAVDGGYQTITRRFFAQDLLSPLLAGALFPDFVQRLLPVGISTFDRARSLEHALENAWKVADPSGPNLLSGSFKSLWKPDASIPALILNTTEVNRGRRELIAPFRVNLLLAPQTLAHLGSVVDVRVSTAMIASARFPWVTPAATLSTTSGLIQLADGGYFENSGAETAHDMISLLTKSEVDVQPLGKVSTVRVNDEIVRVEFRLIQIRARALPDPASVRGELSAPIDALMNARHERGVLSFRRAFFDLCSSCSLQSLRIDDRVLFRLLDMRDFAYPLGWYLTQRSQERIHAGLGESKRCPLRDRSEVSRSETQINNDCLFTVVFNFLRPLPQGQTSKP